MVDKEVERIMKTVATDKQIWFIHKLCDELSIHQNSPYRKTQWISKTIASQFIKDLIALKKSRS